jgi:4-hydroxy-3-polyprenylbenzoate decarboxylase
MKSPTRSFHLLSPGVKAVHAVDVAGVHPLLLAIGSERYMSYLKPNEPQELLTQANAILGNGQLSLAKYLWICDDPDQRLKISDYQLFIQNILTRIDWRRDLHFHTRTTIDTLDYSGSGFNRDPKSSSRQQVIQFERSPTPFQAG